MPTFFSDLIERARVDTLYTSDGTEITNALYHLLPHNCHLFTHDPLQTVAKLEADKPKVGFISARNHYSKYCLF